MFFIQTIVYGKCEEWNPGSDLHRVFRYLMRKYVCCFEIKIKQKLKFELLYKIYNIFGDKNYERKQVVYFMELKFFLI